MPKKITLITPPDIFQNDNIGVLFVDLDEQEQESVSKWLGENSIDQQINIYFYQGEPNIPWLLHALSCCEIKYINLNKQSVVADRLCSYILSKNNVFYKIDDDNLAALYSHINYNRVKTAEEFLERIFGGKE